MKQFLTGEKINSFHTLKTCPVAAANVHNNFSLKMTFWFSTRLCNCAVHNFKNICHISSEFCIPKIIKTDLTFLSFIIYYTTSITLVLFVTLSTEHL